MKSWFNKTPHQDTTDLPLYQRRGRFLSESDRALFDALHQVLGQAYHVFVKVKLSELVEPQVESGNRIHQLHWIKVHRQTVDFIVCRRHDMEPLVALRVFPKTEYARRGLAAYDIVDTVLRDIGLTKITLIEKKRYDVDDLKKKLKIAMAESQEQSALSGRRGQINPTHPSSPN